LITDHESILLQPDKKASESERRRVQSGKLKLTIVWNPNGFHVISVFSKGIKFNADHYTTDVSIPLAEWGKTQVGRTDRNLIIHAADARTHPLKMSRDFMEQNGMRKYLTHRTHPIWHHLISISSPTSSSY
jgi:hypothetical protein